MTIIRKRTPDVTSTLPPSTEPDLDTIAGRVQHARKLAKLGSRQLADLADLSPASVSWVETRGKDVSARVSTMIALAGPLKVTPWWLAFGHGPGPNAEGSE